MASRREKKNQFQPPGSFLFWYIAVIVLAQEWKIYFPAYERGERDVICKEPGDKYKSSW